MVATTTERALSTSAQIRDWIRQWGCASSEAILETHCQVFCTPDVDGFIGYRLDNQTVVVFGDPVCAPENSTRLALAFHEFCVDNNYQAIYMLVSEHFARWAIEHTCKVMIEVCEELSFDPFNDPTAGSQNHRLRNKVNHATNLNLSVHEYQGRDSKLEAKLQKVGDLWVEERKGPQVYLGPVSFFNDRIDRRWFYVQDPQGEVLSVALLRRLDEKEGWFMKFLVTAPNAPRGTSELLLTSLMETLRKENSHYLNVGIVPAKQIGELHGLGKFYKSVVRNLFALAKWIFHLEHRKTYWEQFHPTESRSYILFSKSNVGIKDVRAIMKALNAKM